jgi:hypothetical protein
MSLRPCLFACLAALCAFVPQAEAQDQMRLRGSVVGLAGDVLSVSPSAGLTIPIQLKPDLDVQNVTKASASDLKEGVKIGAQLRTEADASLRVVQLIIFAQEEQAQKVSDANLMEAQILSLEKGEKGPLLTVKYAEGQKKLQVTQDTQLWRAANGSRADLRKGTSVSLSVIKEADGKLTSGKISVSPEGVAPPL